ncbi:ATP-binding cassette domain-containing protein [Streptomyces sp. NRRL B-3648]|uniref:ABC transporter ATP-binding protein n=1 Tax=Streptomyces sp. NRRL B-3648 TaxID=1519493 RepID=UPI0006AF6030|nr:ABC transporter ATP-binding protein [Streptomyces sp. NRRL B-3648]
MIQAFGLTSNPRKAHPPAVDDVSFEARAGHVTVLLGSTGAGKTTALKLMLELQPGRGITYFRGRPLHLTAHPSREVGVLLGDVPGHPSRTVRGHLRMLCAAAGVPARRADEVLEVVGLVSLREERLGTLSRGMDRRLGLACALLPDPHTLVLDEPTDGLSAREAQWLHGMLRAHATQGGTVLFTTADTKEAARTADRVVTLDGGRLVADQEARDFARTRLRPRVAVRSPHAARLAALLAKDARTTRRSVEVVREGGNRLSVYGTTTADVGEIAFHHGILVHQLADEVGDMGPGAGTEGDDGTGSAEPRQAVQDVPADRGARPERGPAEQDPAARDTPHGEREPASAGRARAGGERVASGVFARESRPAVLGGPPADQGRAVEGFPPASAHATAEASPDPTTAGYPAEESHTTWPAAESGAATPDPEAAGPCAEAPDRSAPEPDSPAPEPGRAAVSLERVRTMESEWSASGRAVEQGAASARPPAHDAAPAAMTSPEDGAAHSPTASGEKSTAAGGSGRSSGPTATVESSPGGVVTASEPQTGRARTPAKILAGTRTFLPGARNPDARQWQADRAIRPDGVRPLAAASPLPPPISVRPARSPLRPLRYELRRATGIGTGFLTCGAVLVLSALTAVLLARLGHTPKERLFAAWPQGLPLPPAALAAGLLGALAFGDEFRHPALAADRGTVPRRLGLLIAKLLVSGATALLLAFLTVGCDAEVLYIVYGRELAQVPADWLSLTASWFGLVVGCAWAGVLAAGVFRSTTAGLAAVLAVPVLVVPLVYKVLQGPALRMAAGFPVRLRDVHLLQWPFGGERYLLAAARVLAQPVGGALALSLAALLCAYLATALRTRFR